MKSVILYATDYKGTTKAWEFSFWDDQDMDWLVEGLNNKQLAVNTSLLIIF